MLNKKGVGGIFFFKDVSATMLHPTRNIMIYMKKKIVITKRMLDRMRLPGKGYDEIMGMDMTPKQRNIFLVIDMYWKEFGHGPSIDDIMRNSGDKGRGNVSRIIKNLCELGALKKIPGKDRSVRPAYINFRNIE